MNIGKFKDTPMKHPDTINARHEELQKFMTSCHEASVVVLRALSQHLGLDPETLPNMHKLDQPSVDQARVTFAEPVKEEVITFGEHTGTQCIANVVWIDADVL